MNRSRPTYLRSQGRGVSKLLQVLLRTVTIGVYFFCIKGVGKAASPLHPGYEVVYLGLAFIGGLNIKHRSKDALVSNPSCAAVLTWPMSETLEARLERTDDGKCWIVEE